MVRNRSDGQDLINHWLCNACVAKSHTNIPRPELSALALRLRNPIGPCAGEPSSGWFQQEREAFPGLIYIYLYGVLIFWKFWTDQLYITIKSIGYIPPIRQPNHTPS